MKAMVIRSFGGPEVFELAEEPKPVVKPGHVLVEVIASSLNPVETKIRSGAAAAIAPQFPAILNGDFSGRIVEVGPDCEPWRIGDEVFGCAGGVASVQGALAEFMLVDVRLIARKPANITHQTAALYPLAIITAWEGVMENGFVIAGDKVLVHGASGGVGHLATQLLKLQGAITYGTVTSAAKGAMARKYGTDEIIVMPEEPAQYTEKFTAGRGFDAVFDTVGGLHLLESFAAARYEAKVCTINARTTLNISEMHSKALSLRAVYMLIPLIHNNERERHGRILTRVAKLIEAEELHVHQADRVFSFSEIAEAHRYFAARRGTGKTALVNDLKG